MTEKRFISKDESIINVATDELVNASSEESAEILVDWLNELNDENEQLKSELGKLNILYNAKCKTEEQLIEMGKEVEKENEQLKQQIKEMKIRFKRKYDYEFDEIVDELE